MGSPPVTVVGTLVVHACPAARCPHVEFAVATVLAAPVHLRWSPQPARPGLLRAATTWRGAPGTAAALVARVRAVGQVWLEAGEEASPGCDGERYAVTPQLGLYRADVSATGETVIRESQLRALLHAGGSGDLRVGIETLLGNHFDDELEPFRRAGDGTPVGVLRRTG